MDNLANMTMNLHLLLNYGIMLRYLCELATEHTRVIQNNMLVIFLHPRKYYYSPPLLLCVKDVEVKWFCGAR